MKSSYIDPTTRCPVCGQEAASDKAACQRCRADPYPEDTEIRLPKQQNGEPYFRISRRPDGDTPLWEFVPSGKLVRHQKALTRARELARGNA